MKKKLNIEENSVKVTVSEFEVDELTNTTNYKNEKLYNGIFEILMPNYFISGYQGLNFKNRSKEDALNKMERRSSGFIAKNDILYLAKVSSDLEKVYYKTVVMAQISRDMEKELISIPSRKDLNDFVPIYCTKKMTQNEIKEFKEELGKKGHNSFWICIHAISFGSIKKEFRALETLSKSPDLNICQEIMSGKCRNTIFIENDSSQEIKEVLENDVKMDDYWISMIVKIYQNTNLDENERSDLINILLINESSSEKNESFTINKIALKLIKQLQQDILLPFILEEQKFLYQQIFENQGFEFNLDSKIGNLLLNHGKHVNLNITINEIISQYHLNITQATILAKIKLKENFLSLIQGPPGTGKTKMITAFIYQELRDAQIKEKNNNNNNCKIEKRNKILVCAPIDDSISHITIKKMALRKLYYRITVVKKFFDRATGFKLQENLIEKLRNHHNNIQSKIYELTQKRKALAYMIHSKKYNEKIMDNTYEDICIQENTLDDYIQIFIDNLLLINVPEFTKYKDYIIN
ncbi:hypothetical protein LY90DRAFT_503183 [Neocallimastix californiae]|uniref:DNA2/NAM7 helicase helicase domain-containing protein n=1 Tax=Neocallimastix californiae TaxID=1754190 RepID=A0A1Y2EP71_9FUNG|nr:hypothetical protein LY90DRAFT_503183 [Neocallimastix californiae]|eukprot:ORY73327.1 hypothetical protein LY90DRAFT_503183 [Neocallimastix californiae]